MGKLLQSCRKLNEQVSTPSFVPPKESFLSCSTFKKQLILHQGTAAIPTKYKENLIVILLFVKFPWEPIPKKGKVVHFFRPTFPNPLPMLWMLIWGLFPIGPRLEHLHWIGSIGGVAGMPMLCQFQTMHYQSPAN